MVYFMKNRTMDTLLLKKEDSSASKQLTRLPYFIEIVRNEKKLRIPCANEEVAKKILLSSRQSVSGQHTT